MTQPHIQKGPFDSVDRRALAFAVILLILCSSVFADVKQRTATVTQLDGSVRRGVLQELGSARVLIENAAEREDRAEIDRSKLLFIDFEQTNRHSNLAPIIEFANGDRLAAATITSVQDESLLVRIGSNDLRIPLERLRGIAFQNLSADDGTAATLHRLRGSHDLILLTNGDRLSGQFVGLSATELLIESDGRSVSVPRERVAAIAFSPDLIAELQEKPDRQIVEFLSGWLTVSDLTRDRRGVWRGQTNLGAEATWQEDELSRVIFLSDRAQLLSELEPTEALSESFLDRSGKLLRDRAITGEPLSAVGVPSARGIGVQSRSRLKYLLDSEYEAFSTIGGLSESAGNIGCVEFAIEVDGNEVRRSPPVTSETDPFRVDRLELKSASTITLVVDFARNGDILDRANWCMPILVRPEKVLLDSTGEGP